MEPVRYPLCQDSYHITRAERGGLEKMMPSDNRSIKQMALEEGISEAERSSIPLDIAKAVSTRPGGAGRL